MIVLTGAAGFIGSAVLQELNYNEREDIVCYDTDVSQQKFKNLVGKKFSKLISSSVPTDDLVPEEVEVVIHMGAVSDTTCDDWDKLYQQNIASTRKWFEFCEAHCIPIVAASSASVYGNGNGPLNNYAFSKSISELELSNYPYNKENAAVLRFFNVYGPNEYHKGTMSSVIKQWYDQLTQTGVLKLFENSDLYRRDFIYITDVARIVYHFAFTHSSGIYDVGTGVSVDFASVAEQMIDNLGGEKEFITMPESLKSQYQEYTQANTEHLKTAIPDVEMIPLKLGIKMYIECLKEHRYI